jgi:tetratricopeptide (TPR) repeat protein
VQTFHIAPEEIESQAKADLTRDNLDPAERRQYLALLGGFAYARRQYDDAQKHQQEWLDAVGPDGAPSETANACYNLGNTQLARKDYEAAEATYGKALDLALDHNLGALAPMVLTNLGVTLYRQNRLEHALDAFTVARQTCQAQGLRPAEAHVLDCLARTHEAGGKLEEAGAAWNEALAVYDSMTSETFAQVRDGGRADIIEKLERLSAAAKKAAEDAQRAERGGWFNWRKEPRTK